MPPGATVWIPSAAGLRCNTVSRLDRVSSRSCSSTPATACSSDCWSRGAATPSAPSRSASARSACASAAASASWAWPRWARLTRPAAIATTRRTIGAGEQRRAGGGWPAARARRSRSACAAPASTNARSTALSRTCSASRELDRGGQPRAAQEVGGVAAAGVPLHGGVAQPPMGADRRAVLLEPAAQARPLADERLVRDLRGAVAERDQAGVREAREQRVDDSRRSVPSGTSSAIGTRRRESSAPSPELGHAQEHAARERALLGRQRVDDRVGGARDRGGDAPAAAGSRRRSACGRRAAPRSPAARGRASAARRAPPRRRARSAR